MSIVMTDHIVVIYHANWFIVLRIQLITNMSHHIRVLIVIIVILFIRFTVSPILLIHLQQILQDSHRIPHRIC